jgi:hypothetical protein
MQNFLIEDTAARPQTAFGPAQQPRSRTNKVVVVALACACIGLVLLQTQAGASSLAAFTGVPLARAPIDPANPGVAAVPSAIPAQSAEGCRSGEPKMFIF